MELNTSAMSLNLSREWHGMTTRRQDWQRVSVELFERVVHASPSGICVVSKEETLMGPTLRFRSNLAYPDSFTVKWIRSQFTMTQFDRVFWHNDALTIDRNRPAARVESVELGVPKGFWLVRVASRYPTKEAALLIFSDSVTETELDRSLAGAQYILLCLPARYGGSNNASSDALPAS